MRNIATFAAVLLACATLTAQTAKPAATVTEVNLSKVKPGMTAQWEQGRKQHSAFHRAQNDTWTVLVYQIQSGDNFGNYLSVQPGRAWPDFDGRAAFDKLDQPDVEKNMGPYETTGAREFYVLRPDLSLTREPTTPAKFSSATSCWVAPDKVRQFQDAVKAVNAAIQKSNYPVKPSRWYQLANGGYGPLYVLLLDYTSWADMQPPAKSMEEALGPAGAQALATARGACSRIYTDLLEFRPDLSYLPSGK